MKEDIGKLLVDLAEKRIDALIGAIDLTSNLSGSTDAVHPEQVRELRAGLHNSEELRRLAAQFLIDLANGVDGISCPDDTFETPSVFDISYDG